MHKFTSHFIFFAALAILVNAVLPFIPNQVIPDDLETKTAEAVSYGPYITVTVRDLGCSDQQGSAYVGYPGGVARASDSNRKDIDCANITLNPGDVSTTNPAQSIFSYDFRLGVNVAESESGCTSQQGVVSYTGWASEGSAGGSYLVSNNGTGSTVAADCVNVYLETRPLPEGRVIRNVRIGLAVGGGSLNYTNVATAGISSSSFSNGGDFTSARVGIYSEAVTVPDDADYISTTIPQTATATYPTGNPPGSIMGTLPISSAQNFNIVMKNQGGLWDSDASPISRTLVSANPAPSGSNCDSWSPTAAGQTCVEDRVFTSSKYKLRRIDSNGAAVTTTAGDLPYNRTIRYTYTSYENVDVFCPPPPECHDGGPGGGDLPLDPEIINDGSGILDLFIKKAKADHLPPCDPPPIPEDCTYTPNGTYSPGWPMPNMAEDIEYDVNATFPLTVTANQAGTFELRFQMVKNGSAQFGEIASITVRAGTPWALNCTAEQTVIYNNEAYYTIWATGATSNVSVTMTSNPAGPILMDEPVILSSGNGYTATGEVQSLTSPPGTYDLTFTGTDGTNPPVTCLARLYILAAAPTVDLDFNGSDGPVVLSNTTTGTLSWANTNVTSCTASTTPASNTVLPPWSGNITPASSGSVAISGLEYGVNYRFQLDCTGPGGSATNYVDVSSNLVNPTADLQCVQGSFPRRQSCTANWGASGQLHWNSTNATSCSISDNNPALPDIGVVATYKGDTRPQVTGALYQTTIFSLTCQGVSGTTPYTDNLTITVNANPNYSIAAAPLVDNDVAQGDFTDTYIDVYSPVQGFASNVTISTTSVCISGGGACMSSGSLPSIVSLTNPTQSSPYSTDTLARIDTDLLTVGQTYTVTFNATSGGTPADKPVTFQLTITPPAVLTAPTVNPPSNSPCGQISISWNAPTPAPSSYNVYRRTSSGAFQPSDLVTNTTALSFSQTTPAISPNTLYYYGVSAVYGGAESSIVPFAAISMVECSPDLDGSDKDITRINNRTSTFSGDSICNDTSDVPTNYDIASSGNTVTFRMCVRNSGTVDLTNVTLTELPSFNEFTQNLTNIAFDTASSTCSGSPSGMSWVIGNMPATEPDTSCFIYVTADIVDPTGPAGDLYRFQNVASITASSGSGPVTKQIQSALLLFSKGSGIPDRNETAP